MTDPALLHTLSRKQPAPWNVCVNERAHVHAFKHVRKHVPSSAHWHVRTHACRRRRAPAGNDGVHDATASHWRAREARRLQPGWNGCAAVHLPDAQGRAGK